jgi:hypothetical protein
MATWWDPPLELSESERFIIKRCGKRRVYVLLRELRHRICDERARYRGLRKNLYDLRRHAALSNLSIVDRMRQAA